MTLPPIFAITTAILSGISRKSASRWIDNQRASPGGRVIDDTFRIQLMEEHLVQLHRAIADGANCFGVHQWTFIDNWSWINAFKRRYGFWRLDLETGERQIKRTALWFAELATSNGFTSDK